jgi:hypothetical protein
MKRTSVSQLKNLEVARKRAEALAAKEDDDYDNGTIELPWMLMLADEVLNVILRISCLNCDVFGPLWDRDYARSVSLVCRRFHNVLWMRPRKIVIREPLQIDSKDYKAVCDLVNSSNQLKTLATVWTPFSSVNHIVLNVFDPNTPDDPTYGVVTVHSGSNKTVNRNGRDVIVKAPQQLLLLDGTTIPYKPLVGPRKLPYYYLMSTTTESQRSSMIFEFPSKYWSKRLTLKVTDPAVFSFILSFGHVRCANQYELYDLLHRLITLDIRSDKWPRFSVRNCEDAAVSWSSRSHLTNITPELSAVVLYCYKKRLELIISDPKLRLHRHDYYTGCMYAFVIDGLPEFPEDVARRALLLQQE